MTVARGLRLIDGDGEGDAVDPSPTVFVKTLSSPRGTPWDQARSVALEARLGAPLPVSEIYIEQRRLDPWSPHRKARFAVFYVRRSDIAERFETQIEVEGRSIKVVFRTPGQQRQRLGRWSAVAACAAVMGVLMVVAAGAALAIRADTEDRLAGLEQRASAALRRAKQEAHRDDQARLLAAAGAGHQTFDVILSDLAWASSAKAVGAHIDGLHWEQGYLGVEVRGDTPPFASSDRMLVKAQHPIRPGVWLWGVGARDSRDTAPEHTGAQPTAPQPRPGGTP